MLQLHLARASASLAAPRRQLAKAAAPSAIRPPAAAAARRALPPLPAKRCRQSPTPARAISGGGGGASGGSGGSGGGGGGGGNGDNSNNEPHPLRPFVFAYAAFLMVGGAIAYAKSRSTKSLTAAGGSAIVLALAGRALTGGATKGPLVVVTAISALLAYVMGKRYNKTGKLMPAGVTAGLSFGMALASASQIAAANADDF